MSKRITTFTGTKSLVNIRYQSDLDEYVCRLYLIGNDEVIGEYFTEDLSDALQTGEAMFNKAENATKIS